MMYKIYIEGLSQYVTSSSPALRTYRDVLNTIPRSAGSTRTDNPPSLRKSCYLLSIVFYLLSIVVFAQTDEQKLVREGNKLYKEKKFTESEKNYLNALGKQANSYRGAFNLGDAYYKQGKYKEAAEQFEMLTDRKTSNDTLSKTYHNLGNSYLKQKEFEKSINAYKNALKKNTKDEETRYNLAYAQKMLRQQQQQKQDQDKKNENKDKNKNDAQNKEKKIEHKKEEQQKQNISQEDAQRLLESMNNDEKKLRDKMNEKKVKVAKSQIEKDW